MTHYADIDLYPFLPELVLAGGLLVLVILDLLVKRRQGLVAAWGGVILLAAVAWFALAGDRWVGDYLFGAVVQDGVTVYFRVYFVLAAGLSLILTTLTFKSDGEPYLLIISSVLGMFLLAGSADVVTLFVAFELVSIPSYILAGYRRDDPKSAEASVKYVIYGAFSSGLMIYGLSLLYGLTGTTAIAGMAESLKLGVPGGAHLLAVVLVLAGVGYKIAMVPLHFWSPDVYEGSPTPITAFFSIAPKVAGFAALIRLMPLISSLDPTFGVSAVGLVSLASAVTMTFGNLGALWQDSLKRLLAYSSIAHAGYLLMGVAVMAAYPEGDLYDLALRAVMFYVMAYLFMNLGAFVVVDLIDRRMGGDSIGNFRGLGSISPIPALALAVCLFSLVGLPPLAGFVGKFFLFAALVKGKLFALALIGIANTVVSLFYYVRIIRDMFLQDPSEELVAATANPGLRVEPLVNVLMLVNIAPTLVFGVWWGGLAEWIAKLAG